MTKKVLAPNDNPNLFRHVQEKLLRPIAQGAKETVSLVAPLACACLGTVQVWRISDGIGLTAFAGTCLSIWAGYIYNAVSKKQPEHSIKREIRQKLGTSHFVAAACGLGLTGFSILGSLSYHLDLEKRAIKLAEDQIFSGQKTTTVRVEGKEPFMGMPDGVIVTLSQEGRSANGQTVAYTIHADGIERKIAKRLEVDEKGKRTWKQVPYSTIQSEISQPN